MLIKAVVFDMDGVIFDSERCVFDVWEELARENNLGDMEPTLRACLGVTTEKCKSIMRSMKGEDFPVEHFMKEASLLFHKRYDGGKLPLKPGVRELLAYLKNQGTRLALASSTRESTVTAELRDAGLYDYFDRVVCGNMVTKSKPDPEIFLTACRLLEVEPGEAFAIEDSFNGIRSASSGGLRPIMVPDIVEPTGEIRGLCERVLPTLMDVQAYFEELQNGEKRKGGIGMFDAEKTREAVVQWIRDFFEENGKGCNAIVGISGGKDSSIVAALCVEALGKDRVIGVLMPCGHQHDIDMAYLLVNHLGIQHYEINVEDAVKGVMEHLPFEISVQTRTNIPPRIRMTTLYAVAQSHNGRVANTCNLSEDWVGYSTRYGDAAGDFSPCSHLTVTEMKAIGRVLGLPDVLVDKTPIDGLCGKTDEENLGFTYAELDRYIREGVIEDEAKKARIDRLHVLNQFKLKMMPSFDPEI